MAFTQALYYPWIDIKDTKWLKTSILYWDNIRTIVPESIQNPYSTRLAQTLKDEGFLIPLKVKSNMEEIENLSEDIIKYFNTEEAQEMILARGKARIHREKLPYFISHLSRIHPEKLPYEIRHIAKEIGFYLKEDGDWFNVDNNFAMFYMTLLATRLSDRIGAGLLTPSTLSDRLSINAKIDSPLKNAAHSYWFDRERYREYDGWGKRQNLPQNVAYGTLAHLIIEKIGIDPKTSVDKILEFRKSHSDEIAKFRSEMSRLTSIIKNDVPIENLRQQINDIYTNDVVPSINDLKNALKGNGIKSISEGILRTTLISTGSSSALYAIGLAIPTALVVGIGLSITVNGIIYNIEKKKELKKNPYSYLLSLEKALV